MKKIISSIIIIMVLAACAHTLLIHPFKNASDLERDKYDCHLIVRNSMQHDRTWGIIGVGFGYKSELMECLQKKHGWQIKNNP